MNGIEKIICRIEEDAAKAEKAITVEAQEKIRSVYEKRDAEIAKIQAEAKQKAETERAEILHRAEQSGVTAGRDILLGAKRAQIDAAFDLATASFAKMDKKNYVGILSQYLRSVAGEKEFAGKSCTLIVPEKAPCTAEELIAAAGVSNIAAIEQNGNMKAGFLLKTGEIESPCTPEKIIAAVKETMTAEVAAVLFGA